MPRRRRIPKAHLPAVTQPLSDLQRRLLASRFDFFNDAERLGDATLRALWKANREELLTAHRAEYPLFSRPWPFWRYEHPESPRPGEQVPGALKRLGVLTGEEAGALER